MSGRILITGGAGSMGREAALALARQGRRVRVLDLPQCDFSALEGVAGIEIVRGSIAEGNVVRRAVEEVDAVIHRAAILPPASERDRELTMRVNVEGTRRLLAALQEANPQAHLIFSSSVCVYGDTSATTAPLTVTHPPRPIDLYGESKALAEELVRGSDLPYTTLRISGVAVPAFLAPPEVWPFMAQQRIEYVCRDDVVTALVACVGNSAVLGQTFHVAGGPTWRMCGQEYVARWNEVMGLEPDDALYLERPGTFDWYDTDAAQAILHYQNTSFDAFLELLGRAIEEALGGM